MFIKIRSSYAGNKNIRWIVSTLDMKRWGTLGFTTTGYVVYSDGRVVEDNHMNFRWSDSDTSFEGFDDLESAKLACYADLGVKVVTVNDMKHGDVFSVMIDGVETKCNQFEYAASTYILVMDGVEGGRINPRYILGSTQVVKKYKLEEVKK
jgi:hypothetical protein